MTIGDGRESRRYFVIALHHKVPVGRHSINIGTAKRAVKRIQNMLYASLLDLSSLKSFIYSVH